VSTFNRQWLSVTLLAAAFVSFVDALLLQRSRSLFTGGFLSVDHLDGAGAVTMFLLMSLLVDGAVAGLCAGIGLYVLGRWRLSRAAAVAGAVMIAAGPLLVADVVSYQFVRYLGTGFDLGLMFDLTGRSVAEMMAVAWSYLLPLTLIVGGVSLTAGGLVWLINRSGGARFAIPSARSLVAPLILGVVGALALTAAVTASDALSNGLLRKPSGALLRFIVNQVTDVDRDGFGFIGALADPDPLNGDVFPYAVDIPGNGVDENGIAGDLPPTAAKYAETAPAATAWLRKPDVVLVVLESFRADLVGARYNDRSITPVLNALGARGISSTRAYSHNGYTVQSRFHLLAGTLIGRRNSRTLIDDFKGNGYVVGYFSGQDESFGANEYRVGFDRADVAFDARADVARRYSTFATPGSLAVPFQAVAERVDEFLRQRADDPRPLFMYVNFEDMHFPYSHDGIEPLISDVRLGRDQIGPNQREALWATYVNTAANMDRATGNVIDAVRRVRGRDPGVVVTADHGESLFESGFLGHGYGLNDVQTQVPLIVANLPMRIAEPFGHVDVRSALTEALRVAPEMAPVPTLEKTDRPVFQYLGDLRRPRQIALLRDGGRFIYDFRSQLVQTWQGAWLRPASLAPRDSEDFLRLVHYWEWMNLARRRDRRNAE